LNRETTLARRVAVPLLLIVATIAVWLSPLDGPAGDSLDAGTKRAFVTFATARGLNGAISLMQGTEITGGVGVSATFSVGQVLDPVNDLVERFADLMLLATVSFGVQEVLLGMGQDPAVKIILTAIFVGWIAWFVSGRPVPRWLSTLLILGLMARFAIPLAVVGSEFLFRHFLEADYQASELAVARTSESVTSMTQDVTAQPADESTPETGWFEEAWRELVDAAREINPGDRVQRLKAAVSDIAENVVHLIVVFLLQTLVMPVAILWALYAAIRYVFR
jgi:hypothetical protein